MKINSKSIIPNSKELKIINSSNTVEMKFMLPDIDIHLLSEFNSKDKELDNILKLIMNLIDPNQLTNLDLVNQFVLVYHHFLSDYKLLEMFLKIQQNFSHKEHFMIRFKLLNLMKKLLTHNSLIYENSLLLKQIHQFLVNFNKSNPIINSIYSLISPIPTSKLNYSKIYILFEDLDVKLFCEELSLIDHENFQNISHYELINCFQSTHKTLNLMKFIYNYYQIYFYFEKILTSDPKSIKIIYEIINHLLKLKNFHSLFSILQVLSSKNIKVKPKFSKLLNKENNYKHYRSKLNSKNQVGIPFIGITIKDLIYLQLNLKSYSFSSKLTLLFDFYYKFFQFQEHLYPFLRNSNYRNFIFTCIYK